MTSTVEFLERRALAFCMAGRMLSWPDDALETEVRALAEALLDGDALELQLAQQAQRMARADIEPSYIELFENGPHRCPIHETEYGRMRGLSKGNDLADIEGFYRAFSLSRHDGGQAMSDHLGVEMEFYGTLLAKWASAQEHGDVEGEAVIRSAASLFLTEHLGRFADAVARQPHVAAHPHYGPLLATTAALVQSECTRLDASPAPLDLPGEYTEPEALCCGATVNPTPIKTPSAEQ